MRAVPLAVWLLTLLWSLLLTCWSVLTPTFHAPDEANHAEAVMRLVTGQGWGEVGSTFVGAEGQEAIARSPFGPPDRPYTLDPGPIRAADAPPGAERPDWADLPTPDGYRRASVQQTTQHPPGYYWYAAAAVTLTGGADQPWDRAVAVMRLASVLLLVPLPVLAWSAASRLTGDAGAGLTAATFPFAIPQLTHIGGSVNNDNALTLAAGLVTVGVVAVLRGDRSVRTAVGIGVALGLAVFSKSLGLVLVPMVAAAYLVAWRYARRQEPEAAPLTPRPPAPGAGPAVPAVDVLRPMAVVAVLSFLLGGWWYLANLVRYGTVQPEPPDFAPGTFLGDDPGALAHAAGDLFLLRYWGSLGYFEVSLPWALLWSAVAVVLAAIALALVRASRRGERIGLLLLLWPSAGVYLVVVAQAVSYYLDTHYTRGLQGRYLFLGLVGAAAVVGVGLGARSPGRGAAITTRAPVALLLGGLALQGVVAYSAIDRWWRPVDGGLREAWGAVTAWSAWPTGGLRILVAATALVLFATLVALLRAPGGTSAPPAAPDVRRDAVSL